MDKTLRCVRWGYEVNASSDECINAIDSYFYQVPLQLSPFHYKLNKDRRFYVSDVLSLALGA